MRYTCTDLGVPPQKFDAVCKSLDEVKRGPVGVTYVFKHPKEVHTGKPAAVQAILARAQAMDGEFEFSQTIQSAASPDLNFGQQVEQWDGLRMTATLREIKNQWER